MIWKAAGLKLVKANKTFREQAELSRSMKSRNARSLPLTRRSWPSYWKENRVTTLTPWYISASRSWSRPGKRPSTPTRCNQSVLQRSTTSSESSSRSNSGRGILCRLDIGVESFVEEDWKQRNFGRAPQSLCEFSVGYWLPHGWWSLTFILGEGYPHNATSGHLIPLYCIHWKYRCQNTGKDTRLVGWWWNIEKLCQIVILGSGSSSCVCGGGYFVNMGTRWVKSILKYFPVKGWLHKHLKTLSLLGYEEWLKR